MLPDSGAGSQRSSDLTVGLGSTDSASLSAQEHVGFSICVTGILVEGALSVTLNSAGGKRVVGVFFPETQSRSM